MDTEKIISAYKKLSKNNLEVTSLQMVVSKTDFTSIMYDRFISILAAEGIKWDGAAMSVESLLGNAGTVVSSNIANRVQSNSTSNNIAANCNVGIDIEHAVNMPDAIDYWEDEFYKSNFTNTEIAHCTAKDDPKESFAGIYACKEAILKSDAGLKLSAFRELEIKFDDAGRPSCVGWSVSISHSNGICIAIAVKQMAKPEPKKIPERTDIATRTVEVNKPKRRFFFF